MPAPGLAVAQAARGDADGDGIEDALFARIAAGEPGERFDVIVVFSGPDAVNRGKAVAGPFTVTREFSLINGFQATMAAAQIRGLSHTPGLFRISGVSEVKLQDIPANDDFGASSVRAEFGLDGTGVTICVVDTGINAAHEQFDTKGLGGVPLGAPEFHDATGTGSPDPYDDHGHGTHVAGIAAGDGTGGSGYAADGIGVAPGASLVAAKVLDGSGYGDDAQVIEGIDWCASRSDVDIVSMSLGGDPSDGNDPTSLAVNCAADPSGPACGGGNTPKVVVVAAGNSGAIQSSVMSPGVAANAITVGAVADWSGDNLEPWQDDGLYLTNFSSRGPVIDGLSNFVRIKPDLVAPGSRVHSAFVGNSRYPYYGTSPNYYATLSGTSMAAPYVSGIVALMLEADPLLGVADATGLPYEKVRGILAHTAADRGAPGPDNEYGHGVIDGYSAVAQASGLTSFIPTPYPGYTRLAGESVADSGDWTYEFTVTPDLVGLPVAGTAIIDGVADAVWGIWSPDLEMAVEQETAPGNWEVVDAGSGPSGNAEVTESLCPSIGECGQVGRAEVVHFTPKTAGAFRFRVYASPDWPNLGLGGTFDFEMSMGPAASGSIPNYPPDANFTYSCSDLTCSFIDASTDIDGGVASWNWDFGGTGAADLADPQNPSIAYDATGYYQVTLTVTDDQGAVDTYARFVTARAAGTANQAPVADFNFSNTDLTASFSDTSTDSDGAVVARSWDFGDGSPPMNAANPSHAYAVAGTYDVTLLATDNEGAVGGITLQVSVTDPPPPVPPVASFTVDHNPCGSLFFSNTCEFTDTSTDPDGTIVNRSWNWDGGSAGPGLGENKWLVSFPADGPNPVHIVLTVTDNDGATGSMSMDVFLMDPAPNTAPTASVNAPADGASYTEGDLISFAGTAADAEDGVLTASLVWTSSIDGQIGTGGSFSISDLGTGTHTITASVTDSGGLGGADSVTVTIDAPPPPVIGAHIGDLDDDSVTAARGRWDARLTVLALDSSGSAVPNALISGNWSNGSTGGGSCTTNSSGQCVVTKSNLKNNVPGVTFTVSDISGADIVYQPGANADPDGSSDGTAIDLAQPGSSTNTAPTAAISSPADGSSFEEGTSISFSGSASDPEDGGLSSSISWTSSLNGMIGSGSGFSTLDLSAGAHMITASVTDSGGLSGSATISVTVGSAPPPPPAGITLSASGYKVKGIQWVDLIWEGAAGTDVDITSNGAPADTTPNDGEQPYSTGQKGSGTYDFQICETTGTACSNVVTVTF